MMRPVPFLGPKTFRQTGPPRCPHCTRYMTNKMRAEGHVETCEGGGSRLTRGRR